MQDNVPTLITVHTPGEISLLPIEGRLGRAGPALLETDRLEWLIRRIGDLVGRIDRGSRDDQAALVAHLVRFEVLNQSASRASSPAARSVFATSHDDAFQVSARLVAARRAMTESVRAAGLEDFLQSALARTGRSAKDPLGQIQLPPGNATLLRIPELGNPAWYRTTASSDPSVLTLHWRRSATSPRWVRVDTVGSLVFSVVVLVLAPIAAARFEQASSVSPTGLAALLVIGALLMGPITFAIAIAMMALGRYGPQ
jgi:hypothetical protein